MAACFFYFPFIMGDADQFKEYLNQPVGSFVYI